jgi:hypothetical protein
MFALPRQWPRDRYNLRSRAGTLVKLIQSGNFCGAVKRANPAGR